MSFLDSKALFSLVLYHLTAFQTWHASYMPMRSKAHHSTWCASMVAMCVYHLPLPQRHLIVITCLRAWVGTMLLRCSLNLSEGQTKSESYNQSNSSESWFLNFLSIGKHFTEKEPPIQKGNRWWQQVVAALVHQVRWYKTSLSSLILISHCYSQQKFIPFHFPNSPRPLQHLCVRPQLSRWLWFVVRCCDRVLLDKIVCNLNRSIPIKSHWMQYQ